MRKIAVFFACLLALLATAQPVAADHPTGARQADLRLLQDELKDLDDAILRMEPGNARYAELSDRADQLREDVTYLKVQIRRHQRNRGDGLGASTAEVSELRRQIADLRRDMETAYDWRYTGSSARLPAGTDIEVRLENGLSSETARSEDRVEATVARPVRIDNRNVIPVGTRVRGVVRRAQRAERPARGGELELVFDTMLLEDGSRVDLRSRVTRISEGYGNDNTKQRAGVGALLGGVLGAILKGTGGAIAGAVVGAGGAVAAGRGEDVFLPEGSLLTLRLDTDTDITMRR